MPVHTTVGQAQALAASFAAHPTQRVYFDTETTGLNPRANKLVAIQLRQGEAKVIFDVRDRPEVVRALAPIFERCRIVGHNLKFDLGFLREHGIRASRVYDTQIVEQLILGIGLSESNGRVSLAGTAARYGMEMSKEEREWFYKPAPLDQRVEQRLVGYEDTPEAEPRYVNFRPWDEPFPPEQITYMETDIDVLPTIVTGQQAKLAPLMEIAEIEMRCLLALVEMEHNGIRIDVENWRKFIAEKALEAARLEGEALEVLGAAILSARIEKYDRELAHYETYRSQVKAAEAWAKECYEFQVASKPDLKWGEFKVSSMTEWREKNPSITKPKLDLGIPDIGSPAQLIAAFRRLGIPVPTKKNAKGQRVNTTESKALEGLAIQYPVVKLLLDYRKNIKFVHSFGETLLAFADPHTQRIHSEYNQIGAGTGRFSCELPNFQQIPSKGDGKRIRALVIAAPGCKLGTADFSNIELRILANITRDPTMVDAFNRGLDLHSETARRMFNLPPDVDPETTIWKRDLSYRQIAKIINFMLVYGGSPFKLAMEIGIEVKDAEALVAAYFRAYPGVKAWMDKTKRNAPIVLKATTLGGRQRLLQAPGPEPHYSWENFQEAQRDWLKQRGRIERQALNTPIQGTSADITKLALALFNETCSLGKLVACVHDEIVVECREEDMPTVERQLKAAMKDACDAYLTVSPVPAPKVKWDDHWSK